MQSTMIIIFFVFLDHVWCQYIDFALYSESSHCVFCPTFPSIQPNTNEVTTHTHTHTHTRTHTLYMYIHTDRQTHFKNKIFLNFSLKYLYYYFISTVSPIREVQLELILLQFVIPTLLEHSNTRAAIKNGVIMWSNFVARIL